MSRNTPSDIWRCRRLYVNSEILAELKKLNKLVSELVCLQRLHGHRAAVGSTPGTDLDGNITYLMREFLKHPQIPCPVEHLFGGGKYIREMRIPRGTLFIGRPHRHGHPIQLISGELIWITPHGRFHKVAPDSTV